MPEAALYAPVKAFLEGQGFEVKGEVHGCDLVARRGTEEPLIVELKLRFSLEVVLQGIDRLAVSERVYVAVPRRSRRPNADWRPIRRLCRRIGLGLMLVAVGQRVLAPVEVLEEPVPYRPRRARARAERLLREFSRRQGDGNIGGRHRAPIVTAYRQDALRCASALASGPMRVAALRSATGVPGTASILQRNVYGWFARIERGTYALTGAGSEALGQFAETVALLAGAVGP